MRRCLEKTIKCPACSGSGCPGCERKGKLYHCADCREYLPASKFNFRNESDNKAQPFCREHHNARCEVHNHERSKTNKQKKIKKLEEAGQQFLRLSA